MHEPAKAEDLERDASYSRFRVCEPGFKGSRVCVCRVLVFRVRESGYPYSGFRAMYVRQVRGGQGNLSELAHRCHSIDHVPSHPDLPPASSFMCRESCSEPLRAFVPTPLYKSPHAASHTLTRRPNHLPVGCGGLPACLPPPVYDSPTQLVSAQCTIASQPFRCIEAVIAMTLRHAMTVCHAAMPVSAIYMSPCRSALNDYTATLRNQYVVRRMQHAFTQPSL